MNVVGILGTENRVGITAQMLKEILEGAREHGCLIKTIYLDDYRLRMTPEGFGVMRRIGATGLIK